MQSKEVLFNLVDPFEKKCNDALIIIEADDLDSHHLDLLASKFDHLVFL